MFLFLKSGVSLRSKVRVGWSMYGQNVFRFSAPWISMDYSRFVGPEKETLGIFPGPHVEKGFFRGALYFAAYDLIPSG